MPTVYLDHAATTPVDPEVVSAMMPYFAGAYGNPASLHAPGQEARRAVEAARDTIAAFINADPDEIVFTGGGTESDNLAIKGVAMAGRKHGDHIVTSCIEHHAVLETCRFLESQGFRVTYLPVDKAGMVDPDEVKRAISAGTILISIMHANNEIGTIQPIDEIGRIAREKGIYFHTDAVQTFGHLPTDVGAVGVDLLSASAHKLYGPKGVGILFVKKGTAVTPQLHGGMHEQGLRASTHNVPAIVGMARAIELAERDLSAEEGRLAALRDQLELDLLAAIDGVRVNGHAAERLPGNLNMSIEGAEGETLVLNLDMVGIACSTGSACTSMDLEPSHVLTAIGLSPTTALSTVRFSLGKPTRPEELSYVLDVMPGIVKNLRALRRNVR